MKEEFERIATKASSISFYEQREYILLNEEIFRAIYEEIRKALIFEKDSILIIHDSDIDGYTSAAIIKEYIRLYNEYDPEVTFKPIEHGSSFKKFDIDSLGNQSIVIILDHEVNSRIQKKFEKHCELLIVIDHHCQTEQSGYGLIINDTRWSTSALTAGIFKWDQTIYEVALLASIVNHYDMWLYGLDPEFNELVKCFAEGLRRRNQIHRDIFEMVCFGRKNFSNLMVECITIGREVKELFEASIDRIARRAVQVFDFQFKKTTYKLGLVFHSELCHELGEYCLKLNEELEVACIVCLHDGASGFSIYLKTKPGISARDIEKEFGGTGYSTTSSFSLSLEQFQEFLSRIKK